MTGAWRCRLSLASRILCQGSMFVRSSSAIPIHCCCSAEGWIARPDFGFRRKFRTLPKNSYFTKIFMLYDFHTLPKNSYFTEIFVLEGKFRTPDVQVLR